MSTDDSHEKLELISFLSWLWLLILNMIFFWVICLFFNFCNMYLIGIVCTT